MLLLIVTRTRGPVQLYRCRLSKQLTRTPGRYLLIGSGSLPFSGTTDVRCAKISECQPVCVGSGRRSRPKPPAAKLRAPFPASEGIASIVIFAQSLPGFAVSRPNFTPSATNADVSRLISEQYRQRLEHRRAYTRARRYSRRAAWRFAAAAGAAKRPLRPQHG